MVSGLRPSVNPPRRLAVVDGAGDVEDVAALDEGWATRYQDRL